jgi:hypothetical protein
VIRTVLASSAARRLSPDVWAAAERQLAHWAREYRPDELTEMGRRLIGGLDVDGAEPDHELDHQTNELHLTRASDGLGGWITGRLDSATLNPEPTPTRPCPNAKPTPWAKPSNESWTTTTNSPTPPARHPT